MSLLEDLFNFVSQKRSLAQKEQQSQAIKAFILEPILTPSGLVDDPTHGADAIIIDPNPGIDHSLDFPPDTHPGLDHTPDVDLHLPTEAIPPEHIDLLPFIYDSEPTIPGVEDLFNSGIFTVGESGKVSIDYLFDGGGYQGQLAIFNLDGMEQYDISTPDGLNAFIHEAANRSLSNSDLGHVVIADATEGAKFSGMMPSEWENHNFGEYQGVKTFDMQAGDRFAVMLVPNGTVEQVLDGNQDADIRPLFSLHTVNPNEAFHAGQIADVTGDGNTFVLEDLRTDHTTDRDYNDIIFQVRGATGTAAHLDDVINPELDWRHSDTGHAIIEYAKAYVEPVNPVETSLPIAEVPVSHQPLIGIIDTGVSAHNPDIDYSRLILGHDYIDGDNNPLLASGEGSEHGTHILGIIGATQNNGEGIDGINDHAPIWVGRAVGSGHWADSLVEFVDQARETNQPHAIANLSLDLTQINPDGSVTTRYEFTPFERAAIEYARQNGVLIVTAAGNDGGVMSALGQASQEFDNIITVGAAERVNDSLALSEAFNRTDYSSYGYGLDIVAPGGTVDNPELSTVGDGVGTLAGTSIATAKVTGAASQVWAANPDLSYRQVIEILKDTSTDLNETGWDAETGTGLLNIAAAVSLAKVTTPEEYDVLATVIPDTWSGEGIVTPSDRAVNYPVVPEGFRLRVWSSDGVNLRNSPNYGDRSSYSLPQNTWLNFDAWTYGTQSIDPITNQPDALFFRTWYNGKAYWVPSIWIDGYPPSNPPRVPQSQPPQPPQPSTGNGQNIINAVNKVNPMQWYYLPRDITGDRIKETFCNWFAADVLDQLGVPIPRNGPSAGAYTKPHPIYGTNTPNKPFGTDQLLNFFNGGGNGMWERVSAADAVSSANNGQVVLACNAGHVAVVIPGGSGSNVRIAQAGATNGKDMSVDTGFGSQTRYYFRYKGSVKGSVTPNTNTSYSPPATPGQTRQYIIKSGDTLWGIAQRQLGNGNRWKEIMKSPNGGTFTEAEAKQLRVGQSVYLPVSYQTGPGKPTTPPPSSTPKPAYYEGREVVHDDGWKRVLQERNADFGSRKPNWFEIPRLLTQEAAHWALLNGYWVGQDNAAEMLAIYLNENNGGKNKQIDLDEAIREAPSYRSRLSQMVFNSALQKARQAILSGYQQGVVGNDWETPTRSEWGDINWLAAIGGHHARYVAYFDRDTNTNVITLKVQFFLKDVYEFSDYTAEPVIGSHNLHLAGYARAFEVSGESSLYEWKFSLSGYKIQDGFGDDLA
jgi:hypothetical protein